MKLIDVARIEHRPARPDLPELRHRVGRLESLIHAIEDELSDLSIDDEQRLQNIAERVASYMDDR